MNSARELDKQLADALQECNIICINAILSPELEESNSVGLNNSAEFLAFLQAENIKSVFRSCLEITADDYYINHDTLVDFMGNYKAENLSNIVKHEIAAYNRKLEKYNFNNLLQVLYFALFNGFIVYYIYEDTVPFGNPSETLEAILASKETELEQEKEQRRDAVEALKRKLKQQILADPTFAKMTNQKFRRSYALELWNKLSGEYKPLKQYWSTPAGYMGYAVVEFVELLWSEYKQSKK